ncbi:MAG: hypothetical protein MPJ25_00345 [Pirellulales bacterium]|nr:hypothetical protein [Pirellulales bacterium]
MTLVRVPVGVRSLVEEYYRGYNLIIHSPGPMVLERESGLSKAAPDHTGVEIHLDDPAKFCDLYQNHRRDDLPVSINSFTVDCKVRHDDRVVPARLSVLGHGDWELWPERGDHHIYISVPRNRLTAAIFAPGVAC